MDSDDVGTWAGMEGRWELLPIRDAAGSSLPVIVSQSSDSAHCSVNPVMPVSLSERPVGS